VTPFFYDELSYNWRSETLASPLKIGFPLASVSDHQPPTHRLPSSAQSGLRLRCKRRRGKKDWQTGSSPSFAASLSWFPTNPATPCFSTELVKIKLQTQEEKTGKPPKGAARVGFSGPIECAKHIHRIGGVQGLYRGFWTTALRDSLAFAIYFTCYEGTCRALTPASEGPGCGMSPVRTMIVSKPCC
jgi:hypothetical protein